MPWTIASAKKILQIASTRGMLIAPKKVLRRGAMLDITRDIQSLTTFRRRSGDFMKQLKKTKGQLC